jgi:hypothetical protein
MNLVAYEPPGPVARAYMRSDAFVRGIRGPFGSGKSTASIFEILRRATSQPPGHDGVRRSRWTAIRNTYPELRTTTITTWHQWIPATLGRWVGEGPPRHELQWALDDGTVVEFAIWFVALDRPDDVAKLLSMELTGAWINEAREIPKAVLDGVTGRVGRFPSKMMGGQGWYGIIMDTNPPDDDHWWYRLAEVERPEGFEFFAQPSGLSPQAENLENLPAGYYARQIAGKSDEWVKVYIHGEYGFVRTGKPVWPDYVDGVHCREFDLYPGLPIFLGIDFGLTPACAMIQVSPRGQVRIFDEVVATDMGTTSFSPVLKRQMASMWDSFPIGAIKGDPSGDSRADSDETTCFQILRANGIDATPASTNDPALRIDAVSQALRRMVDGEPGLLIHPRCKVLRKALAGRYAYRRLNLSGEEKYKDVPDKNEYSHVSDALQYAFDAIGATQKIIKPTQKPKPEPVILPTLNRWR